MKVKIYATAWKEHNILLCERSTVNFGSIVAAEIKFNKLDSSGDKY